MDPPRANIADSKKENLYGISWIYSLPNVADFFPTAINSANRKEAHIDIMYTIYLKSRPGGIENCM